MSHFNKNKFLGGFMFILLLAISMISCTNNPKVESASFVNFEQKLGEQTIQLLQNSNHVYFGKVEKIGPSKYSLVKEERVLKREQVLELEKILFNDSGYIFDRTKKCLFIPEIGFRFEGTEVVTILVSRSCKQIKVIKGSGSVILDYDPMAEQLNKFCGNLI